MKVMKGDFNLIFDSHAHYDDEAFENDRDKLLKALPNKGIYAVVNVGTNISTSQKSIELSESYEYIYSAVGIHPQFASEYKNNDIDEIKMLSKGEKVVAIGEVGLDYYYIQSNKSLQLEIFKRQIELSINLNLPILIHDREAHYDTLNLLKEYKPKGVIHCFSGSVEMAREILDLGMYLGIGGVVTFKNARKLIKIVENIPLESIVLETDAPYMAPVPFRGQRCDSSYIKYTAEKIAEIKNVSYEEVIETTKNNTVNLFGLKNL